MNLDKKKSVINNNEHEISIIYGTVKTFNVFTQIFFFFTITISKNSFYFHCLTAKAKRTCLITFFIINNHFFQYKSFLSHVKLTTLKSKYLKLLMHNIVCFSDYTIFCKFYKTSIYNSILFLNHRKEYDVYTFFSVKMLLFKLKRNSHFWSFVKILYKWSSWRRLLKFSILLI